MGETVKTFRQWLSENDISQNKASKRLGVSQQWVCMLCDPADPSRPSVQLLMEIEEWTDGAVSLASWRDKGALPHESLETDP